MSDIFSAAATAKHVHASVDEAIAAIPAGHKRALIIDGTYSQEDGAGLRGVYVQRAPDGWHVLLEGGYTGTDGVNGSVKVAKSWKK